jgi:fluoride exporter
MVRILWIAFGGAAGTVARYLVTTGAVRWLGTAFPYGTLAVNVIGSLILAFLAEIFLHGVAVADHHRLALTTGFTGGFTTYSAFNYEVLLLLQRGEAVRGAGYLLATLVGCALSGLLGVAIARALM